MSVPEKVNESAAQLPKTAWKDTGQTFGDSRSRSFDKHARNQTQSSADHHHEKPADLTANRISSRVCAPICSSPSRNVVIEPEVGPVPGWSERGRSNRGAEGDRKDVTGDIAETLDCIRQSQTGSKLQECVFRDQSWAKWFVSTYEKSTKPEHLKCLRFVSLKMTKGRKASTMIKKMELFDGSSQPRCTGTRAHGPTCRRVGAERDQRPRRPGPSGTARSPHESNRERPQRHHPAPRTSEGTIQDSMIHGTMVKQEPVSAKAIERVRTGRDRLSHRPGRF